MKGVIAAVDLRTAVVSQECHPFHHSTCRAPNVHSIESQQSLRALPLEGDEGGNDVAGFGYV